MTEISVKILKGNVDIFSVYICNFLNQTIRSCKFPAILKNGDFTAVFKKGFKGSKLKLSTSKYFTNYFKSF